jgi:RimJ/RimL family protein N-acetyltransferase
VATLARPFRRAQPIVRFPRRLLGFAGRSYDRGVTGLRTERLLLRQWRDEDLEPFAELNADPETMRYFPAPVVREDSDAFAERARARGDRVVRPGAHRASWRVMERLGMSRDPVGAFEHPRVPAGDPLRPHVLYRLSRTDSAVSRAAP